MPTTIGGHVYDVGLREGEIKGQIKGLLRAARIWKRLVVEESALSGPWPKLGLLDDAVRAEAKKLRGAK